MDALTIVDTFGVTSPIGINHFVKRIKERVRKPIEIHCHNTYGLAVANSIAALEAGAQIVHTTVNGISEDSGAAPLEEVAMATKCLYGIDSKIKFEKLTALSRLVQERSGVRMPPHKAIVGEGVFTAESGMVVGWWAHAKSMNKSPLEISAYTPALVGAKIPTWQIVLGKKSGRDSIEYKLKELGLSAPEDQYNEILRRVKNTAIELKRTLTDEEFKKIIQDSVS